MSSMSKGPESLLPTDIEAKLANVQLKISTLEGRSIALSNEVNEKQIKVTGLDTSIDEKTTHLKNLTIQAEGISAELVDRENKISQKESALNVYANALQEKEKKINKYLSIFDNMKDVIAQ